MNIAALIGSMITRRSTRWLCSVHSANVDNDFVYNSDFFFYRFREYTLGLILYNTQRLFKFSSYFVYPIYIQTQLIE